MFAGAGGRVGARQRDEYFAADDEPAVFAVFAKISIAIVDGRGKRRFRVVRIVRALHDVLRFTADARGADGVLYASKPPVNGARCDETGVFTIYSRD